MRSRILLVDLLELAQQVLLARRELDRCLEHDVTVKVARHRSAHGTDPLVTQPKHLPGLRLHGDLDLRLAVERGNLDFAAERRGCEADRHFAMQVGAFALEDRMRLELDDDVEIAVRPAVHARFAFPRKADAVVLVDAGRNLHRQRLVLEHATDAFAGLAGIGDHLAGAVAGRTRLLDREETLRDAHLASPAAARARLRLRAGLRSVAVARRALLERGDADLRFGAARRLLERKLEVVAQVGAAEHAVAAPASTLPEDLAEDVAERVGKAAKAFRTAASAKPLRGINAGVAELIVGGALLRIRQDLVRLLRLLEFVLGTLVIRIAIRMVLHRVLAIGLLQVVVGRIAIETEHRVVVPLRHSTPLKRE